MYMEKHGTFFYIFVAFILFFSLIIYSQSDAYNLKCIIASEDGNRYCVREREKLELAANLLAKVTQKMKDMVAYMAKNQPNDPRTKRLVEGFNPKKISETLPTSELTAYSENKGEKMFRASPYTIKYINGTYFSIFKYLLQNAKESGIYDPIDYKKNPQQYCGISINDNPYYDLV